MALSYLRPERKSHIAPNDIKATAHMLADYLEWDGDTAAVQNPGQFEKLYATFAGTRNAITVLIAAEWQIDLGETRLRIREILSELPPGGIELTTEHAVVMIIKTHTALTTRYIGRPPTDPSIATLRDAHIDDVAIPVEGTFKMGAGDSAFIATSNAIPTHRVRQHIDARHKLISFGREANALRRCLNAISTAYSFDTLHEPKIISPEILQRFATELPVLVSLGLLSGDSFNLTSLGKQLIFEIRQRVRFTRRRRHRDKSLFDDGEE